MTDSNSVRSELKAMLDMTDDEIASCSDIIAYAVSSIAPLIKDGEDENDARLIHLCTAKAYYQLALVQGGGVSSFSAGEVSFKTDASAVSRAKALLDSAFADCSQLLNSSSFEFKAV